MRAVVIVESPAKAKTINKFLGQDYAVVATYGHIRDLPKKNGSVDPEKDFYMHYEVAKQSGKHVTALVKEVKDADEILLATDPDREGEAISWHVLEVFREKKISLKNKAIKRVVFHEITKRAIEEAIANAREVNMNLVNAQQARRALDYLVGFNLSPLLWKKVRRGLSAGRVQSVALRLVCEREAEIQAFQTQEYWSIEALVAKGQGDESHPFITRLQVAHGNKLDKFDIANQEQAENLLKELQGQDLIVSELEKKQSKRKPSPPFITSTLQQEASRKLGFSAKKTMVCAQKLYEGVEIKDESILGVSETYGLITYMRTDSVNLAQEAVEAIREVVKQRFGPEYLPKAERKFKSTTKNAQEAHEAIRPTNAALTPEKLRQTLEKDMFRLYELIWKRTMACQMAEAQIDNVAATLSVGSGSPDAPFRFRATGSSVRFAGFMKVYLEGRDEVSVQDRTEEEEDKGMLPPLEKGETLLVKTLEPRQHFTEPPPRYTEATLVKSLESYGIGRPSTYAPTMSTLQDRGYVRLESKKFFPEDVGMVVNRFLVEHFNRYVDFHFTAHLEDDLDAVSRGEKEWVPLLQNFWNPFIIQVQDKEKTTNRSDFTSETTSETCPECSKPLLIKLGRFGKFLACSNYPECRFSRNIKKDGTVDEVKAEPEVSTEKCEKCGKPMLIKDGRYGKYLSCSGYPDCRNNQPLEKPKSTGVTCLVCGKGHFLEKKSRYGKIFYSCSTYPACKNALWNKPLHQPCPKCGAVFVTEKITKRWGVEHLCVQEGCDYREKQESATTEQESE
ncbi:MAG: topA [Magnetococcales bacterium]|nr:topA [Magnetococcales bacterium]HIJ85582.1 type I DNA topoisomerase [Magnetococcales bacterium]